MGVASKFRKTEWLIRYYPSYKALIKEKKAKILLLQKHGIQEFSKSIVVLSSASNHKDLEDLLEEEIDKNIKQVEWLTKVVELIDIGLAEVKNEPYYKIIEFRYWENWTMEQIADYYYTATTTIYRNRDKLISKIKNVVFAGYKLEEIIQNMD